MKISIAPIPYHWPRAKIETFYSRLRSAPVDSICLGETVCSKRRELSTGDWIEQARTLARSIPQVVLSSLALVEAGSELAVLKRLVDNGEFMIEANDLATVQLAIERKLPFATGPTVNIYNGGSLALLARQGLQRWVPPVEMSGLAVKQVLDEFGRLSNGAKIETEIFAYGRLPLAHSARCFTARHHDRPKDDCGFVCIEHADGLIVRTRENEEFLRINGIQVQSDAIQCLRNIEHLRAHGADSLRLVPTGENFHQVIEAFAQWCNGEHCDFDGSGMVDGYWYGEAGMRTSMLPGA